jgi:hypothetical protein
MAITATPTTSAPLASAMVTFAGSAPRMGTVGAGSSALGTRAMGNVVTRRVAEMMDNATAARARTSRITKTTRVRSNVVMGMGNGTRGQVDRSCAIINPTATSVPTTDSVQMECVLVDGVVVSSASTRAAVPMDSAPARPALPSRTTTTITAPNIAAMDTGNGTHGWEVQTCARINRTITRVLIRGSVRRVAHAMGVYARIEIRHIVGRHVMVTGGMEKTVLEQRSANTTTRETIPGTG